MNLLSFLNSSIGADNLFQASENVFDLSRVENFPYQDYTNNQTRYSEYESWWIGTPLEEMQTQGGISVEKYPVRINPIRGACIKHAFALFGEVKDDQRPLVIPHYRTLDKEKKDVAAKASSALQKIWWENSGRTIQMRNGLLSQIDGGCVFKASYVPDQAWRRIPIRIEAVHPGNFVGYTIPGDEFRLAEAWFVRPIGQRDAMKLGMDYDPNNPPFYIEYWNEERYRITINNKPVSVGKLPTGEAIMADGPNPFGFVPAVYIPHVRANTFYGESLITSSLIGIVEELNRREADYGDAVSDDSHPVYVGTDISGQPDFYEVAPGIRTIFIKSTPAITGKEQRATFGAISNKQSASTSMKELAQDLYLHFRREAYVPAVADGEDEGSQRSSLTLAMRMWPLLSHVKMERQLWGDGLSLLNDMIARMCLTKGLTEDITPEVLDMIPDNKWYQMLPRDSATLIDELVARKSADLGTLETLLSNLEDIDDPSAEAEEIAKQKEEERQKQQDMAMQRSEFEVGQKASLQQQQMKNKAENKKEKKKDE